MSEEERIWANALSDAIEPANEYARKIKDRYLVTAKNDMYGIDQTMNIISQAYLAGVEHQAEACMERHDSAMNAQRTSAEETERTLRAESVLSDDRLPVKWDGEYIYWADTWTDTMPFLCGNNNLLKDQACPGTDERSRWKQYRPHLWRPRTINGRTTQSKLRLMRCGVCGLTLVEGHPLNGGKETVWRLDESDYGPEGSHPVIQGELDI